MEDADRRGFEAARKMDALLATQVVGEFLRRAATAPKAQPQRSPKPLRDAGPSLMGAEVLDVKRLWMHLVPLGEYADWLGVSPGWLRKASERLPALGGPMGPTIYALGNWWFARADLPIWEVVMEELGDEPLHVKRESLHSLDQGYIYLIQAENGLIKIGWSRRPSRRLRFFRSISPLALTLIRTFPGTEQDEALLHQRFVSQRHHGEWFEPSEELLNLDGVGRETDTEVVA